VNWFGIPSIAANAFTGVQGGVSPQLPDETAKLRSENEQLSREKAEAERTIARQQQKISELQLAVLRNCAIPDVAARRRSTLRVSLPIVGSQQGVVL
jgi:hypothetical protein